MRWLPRWVLLALGVAGFVRGEWAAESGRAAAQARGAFWRGLDERGEPLVVPGKAAVALGDLQSIVFSPAFPDARIDEVALGLELQDERAFVDLSWEDERGEAGVLRLATEGTFGWFVGRRDARGKLERVRQKRGPASLSLFQRAPISVEFAADGVSASLGRTTGVETSALSGPVRSLTLTVRGGRAVIHDLALMGSARGESFYLRDDLSELGRTSLSGRLFESLGRLLLWALLLAVCLEAPFAGAAPMGRVAAALAAWFSPAALLYASRLVAEFTVPPLLVALVLALGYPLALFVLRDVAPARPGRVRKALAALLAVASFAYLGSSCAVWRDRVQGDALRAEREAALQADPAATSARGTTLRADNALEIEGAFRDADITVRGRLSERGLLGVRLRSPRGPHAEGVSFLLSADRRVPGGFFLETRSELARIGEPAPVVEARRDFELSLRLRGRSFEALLDGAPYARGSTLLFPRGSVSLLAIAGEARIGAVRVEPRRASDPPSARAEAMGVALAPALVLSALAFLLGFASRGSWWTALHGVAVAAVPLGFAFRGARADGVFDALGVAGDLAPSALLLLAGPLAAGRALKGGVYALAIAAVVAIHSAAFFELSRRSYPPDDLYLSRMSILDWEGERMEEDLIHAFHPLYRRFNEYLRAHELRGRRHALQKPRGVVRIVALGTSSTFGYLAREPYAFRVEKALRDQGLPVEVLVAAWPGSSGTRQLAFLRNVMLQFDPDILTLSLFYNDSYQLSMIDELAYERRITAAGYRRGPFDSFLERVGASRAEREYRAALRAGGDVDETLRSRLGPGPPRAFESVVRAFAELARERDLDLVLIKEPTAGVRPWRGDFYDVLDRVGSEYGLVVVDPNPVVEARGGRSLFVDIVHPTDEGHAVMAEVLVPHLRKLVRGRVERP